MQLDQDKKKYTSTKNTISLIDTFFSLAMFALLALTPLSKMAAALAERVAGTGYLSFILFAAICAIGLYAIGLPLSFLNGYLIEKKFNLSNQTLLRWIGEEFKSVAVGSALAIPAALALFFFLQNFQDKWWILFSVFIVAFSLLVSFIAPVILMPIFHKIKPLDNEALAGKIRKYAQDNKIKIASINEFDISKNTKKANAAFTGFGKTKKILLGDTLIKEFSEDEILAVFAHEAGHFLKKHILKSLLLSTFTIPLSLFACSKLQVIVSGALGYSKPFETAAIPLFLLLLSAVALLTMPAMNALSRHFERQADAFAVKSTNDVESFINAMKKLSDMNLSDEKPNALYEFLFYSHPAIGKRIELARKNAAEG